MTGKTPKDLADALVQARTTGKCLAAETFAQLDSTADAYAVQSAVASALASRLGPVAGWKTGRAGPGKPISFAPIFAHLVRPSPARFTETEAHLRGVELEYAFRLDDDPLPPDLAGFDEAMRSRVSLVPVIEVVGSRYLEGDAAPLLFKVADMQMNAGLVIGEPLRDWSGIMTESGKVHWDINGEVMADGPAMTPGGDAFATFCAFAQSVGQHCGGLRKGQIVATGSLTGVRWAPSGARVVGEIAGLGAVETTFT